jgi:hypothetical protein
MKPPCIAVIVEFKYTMGYRAIFFFFKAISVFIINISKCWHLGRIQGVLMLSRRKTRCIVKLLSIWPMDVAIWHIKLGFCFSEEKFI